jgi:hypothetical protein
MVGMIHISRIADLRRLGPTTVRSRPGQNGPFAALPSRPVLDQEGRQKRDVNGKPQYLPFLQWRDRSLSSRFSDSTVALVLQAQPEFANGDGSGQ